MTDTGSRSHLDFLAAHHNGVLVTLKRDGRPQISNIVYDYSAEAGRVRISVTADRAKTRNALRDPRVSMHIGGSDFWAYVVVEGEASLTPVTTDPHDATAEALVGLYRSLGGEHPNWDEYRTAMVQERRQVLSFAVTHAYGRPPE
jgi:PPOX class probable F420-dependent enzyme